METLSKALERTQVGMDALGAPKNATAVTKYMGQTNLRDAPQKCMVANTRTQATIAGLNRQSL